MDARNILVPFDFSTPAVNAFRFALRLASQSKAIIHLLHAIELPILNDPLISPTLNFEGAYAEELKINYTKEFEKLLEIYKSEGADVQIISKLEFGSPSKTILQYVTASSIDLIVMGSHGAAGLQEVLIGSNAEKIVRRSSVPVLVIKNYLPADIKNIVFPSNLELEHQEDLLAKMVQDFFHANLHIVFINTPENFVNDAETYSKLHAFADHFMLENFTLNVYNHFTEAVGILQFSKKIGADLIVMATHGHRGILRLINGSLAEDVTNHSEIPIWSYSLKNRPLPGERL